MMALILNKAMYTGTNRLLIERFHVDVVKMYHRLIFKAISTRRIGVSLSMPLSVDRVLQNDR